MTAKEVMKELESYANPGIRKIYEKHGITLPIFGVKVEDMKKIQKKVKKDYELSKELYATGNADAMYLAGLIADDMKMTKKDLQTWVKGALAHNISEYTVPWVAAEGNYGWELAIEWIDAKAEHIQAAGWATLAGVVSMKPDTELDLKKIASLLERVEKTIQKAGNRVKYVMNNFVICVGAYVVSLNKEAIATAKRIGIVTVDMGDTSCKVPSAPDYIKKATDKGSLTKKKKTVKC